MAPTRAYRAGQSSTTKTQLMPGYREVSGSPGPLDPQQEKLTEGRRSRLADLSGRL